MILCPRTWETYMYKEHQTILKCIPAWICHLYLYTQTLSTLDSVEEWKGVILFFGVLMVALGC